MTWEVLFGSPVVSDRATDIDNTITHVLTLELELLLDVKTKAVALAPAQVRGRRPLVASV